MKSVTPTITALSSARGDEYGATNSNKVSSRNCVRESIQNGLVVGGGIIRNFPKTPKL